MPTIRQLPQSVINKIAAGEVIERPASVVKELLENSVDAGATRVDVSLEQGGLELIRIADNGCGIEPEQLSLAVASHATSKIQDADDLFRVKTLGFRGEALASIAEISQLRIRSRTAAATAGAELEVYGGQASEIAPCGCPVGTIMEVRNLFFNTPVRRKFMRSSPTEFGHCSETFTRLALAYPTVHFTLRHNERVVYDLPPTEGWRDRITTFFGAELGNDLIWVESAEDVAKVSGYVAAPTHNRANNRLQYLFLNGRFIRDRSLQHALSEAYRGLLLTGRYPIAFLRLELQPDAVDVNVHPTKMEVRFEDSGRIYSQLLGALRSKFLSTDLTAKVAAPTADETGLDRETLDRHRREVADWARGSGPSSASTTPASSNATSGTSTELPSAPAAYPSGTSASGDRTSVGMPAESSFDLQSTPEARQARFSFQPQPAWRPVAEFRPFGERSAIPPLESATTADRVPLSANAAYPTDVATDAAALTANPATLPSAATSAEPSLDARSPKTTERGSSRGLQVHNRYIVTETEAGLEVIDQHALHERILYEQIRERVLAGRLEKQRLLVPEPVRLTAPEIAAVLDSQETLRQLGIEVEPFGGDTVLVSSYPAMLSGLGPQAILRQAIELLMGQGKGPDRRDLLDELLHMISCKAAVKAGDRLAAGEIDALLEQRHMFRDTHHCPHGRPTALVFTREELDRRFLRT